MTYEIALEEHIGLARKVALTIYYKYKKSLLSYTLEDLIQEATIGLLRAVDGWVEDKGKFNTYAYTAITTHTLDSILKKDKPIRHAKHLYTYAGKIKQEEKKGLSKEEAAGKLGYSKATMEGINNIAMQPQFLEESTGENALWQDVIGTDCTEDFDKAFRYEKIVEALKELKPQEQQIIFYSYFEGRSLRDVGKVLGVSGERVRQVKQRAEGRLKVRLAQYNADFF